MPEAQRTAAAGAQADVRGAHALIGGVRGLVPQPRHDARRMVLHQHRIFGVATSGADVVRICWKHKSNDDEFTSYLNNVRGNCTSTAYSPLPLLASSVSAPATDMSAEHP